MADVGGIAHLRRGDVRDVQDSQRPSDVEKPRYAASLSIRRRTGNARCPASAVAGR